MHRFKVKNSKEYREEVLNYMQNSNCVISITIMQRASSGHSLQVVEEHENKIGESGVHWVPDLSS
jgi:hypothetical protein